MIENQDTKSSTAEPQATSSSNNWEREVLEKLVMSTVTEQRKTRRWGIFFKTLFFVYLVVLLGVSVAPFSGQSLSRSEAHTAVVDVVGIILDGADTNAQIIIEGLRAAVEDEGTRGIILRINTPGGSPVHSSYVYDEIRRIKKENPDLPIYAVASDICASGGYFIASAADKIFVNQSTIIGSIGVVMNGFGFVETMKKFGIERRLMIAGENKALMDSFSPLKEEEKKHMQMMLDDVHQTFITAVREGRGEKLTDDPAIFSGLVWTGQKSIELGLADDFGTTASVAKELIGEETLVNFTPEEKFLDKLTSRIGTAIETVLWQLATNLGTKIL